MTRQSPAAASRRFVGTLDASKVRDGVPRGKHGAWQRRVRTSVFGEPAFDFELVAETKCAARPHIWAYSAWKKMCEVAVASGANAAHLAIHSGYRSVDFQRRIFDYRLNERREARRQQGLPRLSDKELRRIQQKWTAYPGRSAHHTGFALDFGLYHLGVRDGRKTYSWDWLMRHARDFGFYPYLVEPWHWEFNPPGLVDSLRTLRNVAMRGGRYEHLLSLPSHLLDR